MFSYTKFLYENKLRLLFDHSYNAILQHYGLTPNGKTGLWCRASDTFNHHDDDDKAFCSL